MKKKSNIKKSNIKKSKKISKIKKSVKRVLKTKRSRRNPITIRPGASKIQFVDLTNDDCEMKSLLNGLYYTYYDVVKNMEYNIPFWALRGMIKRDIQDGKYNREQEKKLNLLADEISKYNDNLIVQFPIMQ